MKRESSFDNTYPFDEFCTHVDELQHGDYFSRDRDDDDSDVEPCFEKSTIVVMEYMHERFTDEREAFFKGSRYVMILSFLSNHLSDFDRSDYAVYGSPKVGALTSAHLLKAVHYFCTSPEWIFENKKPTPEEVMTLADSFRGTDDGITMP